jgi:hypothetical protein
LHAFLFSPKTYHKHRPSQPFWLHHHNNNWWRVKIMKPLDMQHYATNRQVAASIPDGVIGIFQWHNPSGLTLALGSTHPLTEMSNRCISWGLRRPVRKADNFTTILYRCHEIWEP